MNEEIIQLFNKYLNNQYGPQELDRVMELLKQGKYRDEWAFVLTEASDEAIQGNLHVEMSPEEISAWHERIKQTLQERSVAALPKRKFYWPRFAAAAIILLVLSFGIYLYIGKGVRLYAPTSMVTDIAPGGNKAVLTLADGNTIALSEDQSGIVVGEDSIMYADGSTLLDTRREALDMRQDGGNASESHLPTKYYVLSTPRGGQYRVILSDGTKVWLNADSRLTYPSHFGSKERRVKIAGEAYFEVAKMKTKPFRVESDRQVIEVLGTHFNITDYAEEAWTSTTLLEGSVQVTGMSDRSTDQQISQSTILRPGQQSRLSDKSTHVTSDIDLEEITAWKNGYFKFSESLESIMAKVARWYDVEVVYRDDFGEKLKFYGKVSRSKKLSAILEIIEATENVRFQVTGRRVVVMR